MPFILYLVVMICSSVWGVLDTAYPYRDGGVISTVSKHYNYLLQGEISGFRQKPLIWLLNKAKPGDIIYITVNSQGGYTDVAQDIYTAVDNTQGTVVFYVPIYAASAAAYLLCHGNNFIIKPKAIIYFHWPLTETITGKTVRYTRNSDRYTEAWLDRNVGLCQRKGFLTNKEVHDMEYKDKQLPLKGKEILRRLKANR
jgi:ATP-dependent protease ClpP protease subunit